MYITLSELLAFGTFVIALIALMLSIRLFFQPDSCIGCDGPSPDSLLADRCSTYRGVPASAHAAMRSVHNSGVLFSQIHTAGFALSPAHWE